MLKVTEDKIVYNKKHETIVSMFVLAAILLGALFIMTIVIMASDRAPLAFRVFMQIYFSVFFLLSLPYAIVNILFGLTAEYVFDTKGIHLTSLFINKHLPWEKVVDYGFTYSFNDCAVFEFTRTTHHIVLYFSDKKLKKWNNRKKRLGFTVFRIEGSFIRNRDVVFLEPRRYKDLLRNVFEFACRHAPTQPYVPAELYDLIFN